MLFKLAIPSIIFAFINFFPKKVIRGEGIEMKELLADTLGGCSLWFTCSLVLVELFIFAMLLTRSNRAWGYLVISVLVAMMGLFLINQDTRLLALSDFPWFYKRAMLALLYVVSGGLYFKYEGQIVRIVGRWYVLAMLVAFYFVVEYMMPEKALCLTSMGEMNVLGACVSVVGSVLLIELCRKLKENVVLTFVAKNSIVFYFFSGALPATLSVILSRAMEVQNVAGMMIVFVLSLLIGAVVAYVINRWLPWLLDVRKVYKR